MRHCMAGALHVGVAGQETVWRRAWTVTLLCCCVWAWLLRSWPQVQKPRGRGQLPSWASMAGTVSLMVLDVFGCLVKGTCTLPSPPKAISSSSPGPPLLGFPGSRWGRSGERDWNVTSPCSERCCDPRGLCHRGGDALTPWDGSLAPSLGQVKGVCSGSGLIWKTLGKSAQQDY